MQDFVVYSLIGSVVLTVLINLIPMLFPKQARNLEQSIHKRMEEAMAEQDAEQSPRVKVFFPWRAMVIASLVLTVVINVVGLFAGRG